MLIQLEILNILIIILNQSWIKFRFLPLIAYWNILAMF